MQIKRLVRRYQEYPETVWQEEFEVLCPKCKKWTANYGHYQTKEIGTKEWFYVCQDCGEKVWGKDQS